MGSLEYRQLSSRLDQLSKHLLYFLGNPYISKLSYSDQEFDATRAYIVLAHAEIEAFCERLVRSKAQAAKLVFDNTRKVRPSLRRIIVYHVTKKGKSWSNVVSPQLADVNAAFASYKTTIQNNHGIKRKNLEKLLFPLGVRETTLNSTWLAQMDSFGNNRGVWAHNNFGVQSPPDPLSQVLTVRQLLQGLLDLDRMMARIR